MLGERIERNLYKVLECLIRAKYAKERKELLERANLLLVILRFQVRLAKDLPCLAARASRQRLQNSYAERPAIRA